MDARRWSTLWVFVGGCLTGAAVIGAGSVEEDAGGDSAVTEVAERGEAPATQSASDATKLAAASATDTADRDKADAGDSVAEVLARLETEYRERSAAAQDQAPALPATQAAGSEATRAPPTELSREQAQEPSVIGEVSAAPKQPASEPPAAVRAAAAVAEAPAADARSANSAAQHEPTASATEEAARLASIRAEQAKALDSGQQQLAQMQQLTALQQAALIEQYTLLQLQLLSISPAPRTPVPVRSQRRTKGERIVASLPSSISDMDNPWGFDLQRSVLVR